MSGTLVIRTDANTAIGSGHLMRCLALGQAWQESGGSVVFMTTSLSEWLLQCLINEGFVVRQLKRAHPDDQDLYLTKRLLAEHPGAWLVLDGYHFDSDYQRKLKEAGYRLMVIDDMARLPYYCADIILNQNLYAQNLRYSREPHTRMCLGTRFVLLRRDFRKWSVWNREIPEVACKLLITLGSSDPSNVTLKVVEAVQQVAVTEMEVVVVVGPGNSHYKELQCCVRDSSALIRVERHVRDMPALMAWADVAVSAGGSSVWEMAFMAAPCILVILAENQRQLVQSMYRIGAAANLGHHENLSAAVLARAIDELMNAPEERRKMSKISRALVDGLGASRVTNELLERYRGS